MNDKNHIVTNSLFHLARQLEDIKDNFQDITFQHIFREHNLEFDQLSKEGISMIP